MGPTLRHTGSMRALHPVWSRLVGELVARHSRPMRWEGTTLVIGCDSDAWRSALTVELPTLVGKVSSALGNSAVTSIVLEVE
jgi:predicted nucleic acid-binding Zn ribbon protein